MNFLPLPEILLNQFIFDLKNEKDDSESDNDCEYEVNVNSTSFTQHSALLLLSTTKENTHEQRHTLAR
jgi:hypothetical protein